MLDIVPLKYLDGKELDDWDKLVSVSPYGSLFCYSWWLKAASSKIRILAYYENNRLVAGIPLYFKKVAGYNICTMPKLTQTWGVVIEPMSGKQVSINSRVTSILKIFARVLSRLNYFTQNFNSNNNNYIPFYWNGFKQTARYTYILSDISNIQSVWNGFRQNIRTDIKKAEQAGITVEIGEPESVYQLIDKSFNRQNKKQSYSFNYFNSIYHAARENNCGKCFIAKDQNGNNHAAAFLVWDHKRAYYLAGGGDPLLRNSGATSLLIWSMIKYVSPLKVIFDFEGSMIESVERYFRAFGSQLITFNHIYKYPLWIELFNKLIR